MFKIINEKNPAVVSSSSMDLYQYQVYIGDHLINTRADASYWYIDDVTAISTTGNNQPLHSKKMCVEIVGYTPETRTSGFSRGTDLPYINGCSTKQLIPPARPGDPTFQMLYIPAGTSEQAHHIHATARIVYVVSGSGKSIVGTSEKNQQHPLNPGDVIILGKMVPHHFETEDSDLLVLPVHIFSSIASEEFNHPMFNGTHQI